MSFFSWAAVYFIVWWICLFIVLPFRVKNQHDTGEVVRGTEPGAPVFFRLWPQLLATSVLAGIVLLLAMWGLSSETLQHYWE